MISSRQCATSSSLSATTPEELYSDRQVHSQRSHLPFWIQQTKSTCEPREPAAVRTKSENETGVLGRTVEIESAPAAAACRDLGRRDMSVPTIATGVLGRREMSVPSAEAGLGLGRASIDEQLLSSLTPDVRSASGIDWGQLTTPGTRSSFWDAETKTRPPDISGTHVECSSRSRRARATPSFGTQLRQRSWDASPIPADQRLELQVPRF